MGLADNAAFIVAPRARSQHLDLGGRTFLHHYDHRLDLSLGVLTLIMTAPMVVTNWINTQYHASTVDNRRYGSGNKVLHNVVGGHLGVFEGNGGDLRIGLPMQSLHDGHTLRLRPALSSSIVMVSGRQPPTACDSVARIPRHMGRGVTSSVNDGWTDEVPMAGCGPVSRRQWPSDQRDVAGSSTRSCRTRQVIVRSSTLV